MPNMSYCRFENTNADLFDCVESMKEVDEVGDLNMNEYEQDAFRSMYEKCKQFITEFERLSAEFID